MTLTSEEASLFFEIYFSLLDYTNSKYDINELDIIECVQNQLEMPYMLIMEIADYLWDHISIIDEFIEDIDFTQEAIDILLNWKKRRRGRFLVERNLKKGSILIDIDNQDVYLVKGLISSIEDMVPYTPIMIETTLIPFKDNIVTDGLLKNYNIQFGKGSKSAFKQTYMNAKNNDLIISKWEYKERCVNNKKLVTM